MPGGTKIFDFWGIFWGRVRRAIEENFGGGKIDILWYGVVKFRVFPKHTILKRVICREFHVGGPGNSGGGQNIRFFSEKSRNFPKIPGSRDPPKIPQNDPKISRKLGDLSHKWEGKEPKIGIFLDPPGTPTGTPPKNTPKSQKSGGKQLFGGPRGPPGHPPQNLRNQEGNRPFLGYFCTNFPGYS